MAAQDLSILDDKGFQPNRDYFAQLPFENIDLMTGSLVLTFTDLVLPGEGGRELRFQRTWNSKSSPQWTLGIAGVALRVADPGWAPVNATLPDPWAWAPSVITSDGATRRTTWMDVPDTSSALDIHRSMRWVSTAEFWRYDRLLRVMFLPDGTLCRYDEGGRLTQIEDVFGNVLVTLAWAGGALTVSQHFATGQPRVVVLDDVDPQSLTVRPAAMHYAGRTWTYEWGASLIRATSPVGLAWEYTRETATGDAFGQMTHVKTPAGGIITYTYARQTFATGPSGTDSTVVVKTRSMRRRDTPVDVPPDTWTYTYNSVQTSGTALETVVETPIGTRVTYRHAAVDDPAALMGSHLALVERIVEQRVGEAWQTLESEQRRYESVPVIQRRSRLGETEGEIVDTLYTPEFRERTVQRDGRTYVTRYDYRQTNYGTTITRGGSPNRGKAVPPPERRRSTIFTQRPASGA